MLPEIVGVNHTYPYFPILIDSQELGKSRDAVYEELKAHNIFGRRYFYPLISQFPTYRGLPSAAASNLPVATRIADQVICLPIYPDLDMNTIPYIARIIRS